MFWRNSRINLSLSVFSFIFFALLIFHYSFISGVGKLSSKEKDELVDLFYWNGSRSWTGFDPPTYHSLVKISWAPNWNLGQQILHHLNQVPLTTCTVQDFIQSLQVTRSSLEFEEHLPHLCMRQILLYTMHTCIVLQIPQESGSTSKF